MKQQSMCREFMRPGFTLIEILVFLAIFSSIVVAFTAIFIAMVNLQTNQSVAAEVNQQSQFLLQQIQYDVSSARLVDMAADAATGTLTLRGFSTAQSPLTLTLSNGTVYAQQGAGGALQPLTSNKVAVSNLLFTRHFNLNTSSTYAGTDSVSFSFTMSATSTNGVPYSQTFQSSVAVLAPVGKIAMIQQANAVANSPLVATLSASYPTSNETGSLLLAVVANTTSSASVALSDSAGNLWMLAASESYPAYNENLSVFYALNAKNSANTVSTTFTGGAGYASLFIYEYRGASPSSSLDVSSAQLQPNTQTPSSGLVNPTSTVELLFGVTYNGNTFEVPAAGNGFTLETSSTITHVFAEDSTQYITGPVAAPWQYSGTTPSSSALIVTFR